MSQFIYVTYIRAPREKVWAALTTPETMREYWFGMHQETDWKPGSPWKLVFEDGRVADAGEIVECEKPNRIVIKWRNEFKPEFKEEGYTRCVMSLEYDGELTKLTIDHSIEREGAKIIAGVSDGWPKILSSLKSLLETGKSLERFKS
ncbi:MAG TPA: SRPBCC family protein [Rhizomicrobium sp.]|jgi:uncharacterized protein YndB with AHSA1/START domain|nr:SRPBCC family protein [Rhizomicrobium sp.]